MYVQIFPVIQLAGRMAVVLGLVVAPCVLLADEPQVVTQDDVVWTEIVEGVEFGAIFGDWGAEAHGKWVKFQPGVHAPFHTHSEEFWAVVVSGTVVNPYVDEENPPEMGPGTAWYTPAGAVHSTGCVSDQPCVVYAHMNHGWDIEVVEQD